MGIVKCGSSPRVLDRLVFLFFSLVLFSNVENCITRTLAFSFDQVNASPHLCV